jgi:methyl coenzyme M reductase alpha subunit
MQSGDTQTFPAGVCVKRVEGGGHFIHVEKPREVTTILEEWFGGGASRLQAAAAAAAAAAAVGAARAGESRL